MTPQAGQIDELPKRLLTITDVAEILDVTPRHIRRLVFEKRIPYIKWGHLIRFHPHDLAIWLQTNRLAPPASPASPHRP